jgi:hypothetical protein
MSCLDYAKNMREKPKRRENRCVSVKRYHEGEWGKWLSEENTRNSNIQIMQF